VIVVGVVFDIDIVLQATISPTQEVVVIGLLKNTTCLVFCEGSFTPGVRACQYLHYSVGTLL
jgi:hypothetical protein